MPFRGRFTETEPLNTPLIATGIGAFVVVIGTLISYFTNTKKGAEQLDAVMAGLSAAFDVFRDILVDVGAGIISVFKDPKQAVIDLADTIQNYVIKQFNLVLDGVGLLGSAIKKVFEGDFSGALDDAAEGAKKLFIETNPLIQATSALGEKIKETTNEIIKETNAAYNLSLQLAALRDTERELNKERAVANKQLAEARLLAADESANVEDRIAALEEINKIEDELLAKEIALAQAKYDNIVATNALSDSSEEALNKEAQAYIDIQNLQTASFNKQKGNERELTRLRNLKISQEKAAAKEIEDAKKAEYEAEYKFYKELSDKIAADKAEQKKKEEQEAAEREAARIAGVETAKENAKTLANEVGNAILEANAANIEREKEQKLNAVQETQNRELEIVNARLEKGLINDEQAAQQRQKIEEDAARKSEQIQKEAALKKQKQDIAQAIANGALAVTKTLANLGFPVGALAAVGVAAQTALQVATIKSQKFEKGGMIEGNSHAEGGVPFTVDGVGGFEAEGGEVIINKRSAAMFRKELSVINQAGGGVKFANGGVVGSDSGAASSDITNQLQELIEVSKRPTRAVVSETEITNSQSRISNIEARSSF